MVFEVLSRVCEVCFVGRGNDRVQVETRVGCPAPSWKDWNAEAGWEKWVGGEWIAEDGTRDGRGLTNV